MRSGSWVVAACALLAPVVAEAQMFTKADKREAEGIVAGTFYLRVDVPIDTYRVVPMLEVSPEGFDARKLAELTAEERRNVYYLFNPNDTVGGITLRWGYNSVRLWGENSRQELLIDLVRLKNLDDFKKAFDKAFSRVPLQDAHPDWPAEVRQAVAARRAIEGMTREQTAAVVGTPASIENKGEGVEVWLPRQASGTGPDAKRTGFPARLEFRDGRLAAIEGAK